MSSLIGFNIYRTENYCVENIPYTVRFAKSNDSQENRLFVSNDSNGKQAHYNFSEDTANDFELYDENKLESVVLEIIQNDIKAKNI